MNRVPLLGSRNQILAPSMEPFVTVAIFTLPTEHPVARAKLESEGIACRVIDEYTIDVYHFISNGVGGIKLQVPATDYERAKALLIAGGFLPAVDEEKFSIIERLSQNSRIQSLAGKAFIGLMVIAFAVLIVIVTYSKLNRPDPILSVLNHEWCVDHFTYKGKTYYPATIEHQPEQQNGQVRIVEWCDEKLVIVEDGRLLLPGYYGPPISGHWHRDVEYLNFGNLDTLPHMFGGRFTFKRENDILKLSSENTEIICYTHAFHF